MNNKNKHMKCAKSFLAIAVVVVAAVDFVVVANGQCE
jgi:hypothetical protein